MARKETPAPRRAPRVKAPVPAPDKPYHHGDLRRALVDAAVALVAEKGYGALTLREVARRAGVSHAAPYWHFPDRDHLLAAAAEVGFAALTDAMLAASARAHAASGARLLAIGRAYVRFAISHPAYFRLIFGPLTAEKPLPNAPSVSGRRAFEVLVEHVAACQKDGVVRGRDPTKPSLAAWATVHGLATLLIDGRFGPITASPDSPETEAVLDYVVKTILDGIGVVDV